MSCEKHTDSMICLALVHQAMLLLPAQENNTTVKSKLITLKDNTEKIKTFNTCEMQHIS